MATVLDFESLAKILKGNVGTLKKTWSELPHFFIYEGRDRRSARFILEDVLDHYRMIGVNYGYRKVQNQKRAALASRNLGWEQATGQQSRIRDEERSCEMGTKQAAGVGKTGGVLLPFDVFQDGE